MAEDIFGHILNRLKKLKKDTDKQSGLPFLKRHVYTQEQLNKRHEIINDDINRGITNVYMSPIFGTNPDIEQIRENKEKHKECLIMSGEVADHINTRTPTGGDSIIKVATKLLPSFIKRLTSGS